MQPTERTGRDPDFLLVGAAKCGTTWFCDLLGRHPQVYVHPKKELDFFSFDERYARGIEWYRAQFAAARDDQAAGEGSPSYAKRAKRPHAAERIARHLPHVRLLYLVRHPLRRIESAYLHALRAGHRRAATFARTIRTFPEYVDTSDYGRQLEAYLRHFPAERILVLFLEDLAADPHAGLRKAFAHLGVDPNIEVDLAGAERNASEEKTERRASFLGRLWVRRGAASPSRPRWDRASLEFVRERLEEPTRRFLREHGKPEDFWRWDEGAAQPEDGPAETRGRSA